MSARFLEPDAVALIRAADGSDGAKDHAIEVVEKGYTVIPGAVSPSGAANAIADFRDLEAANPAIFGPHRDANGHYPRILNLHTALPSLVDLFGRNSALTETIDLLFGRPATLYTSLFYETGSQQELHRDSPVFATKPDYLYFGATVYLEPTDVDNGCLEVMEGGHRLPEPDRAAMATRRYGSVDAIPPFDNDMWVEYQDGVRDQGLAAGLTTKILSVRTGDTVIWHPQTPHGGTPIRDFGRTRFSLVMHIVPEDVPVYHQQVFFNPDANVPTMLRYTYQQVGSRRIVDQRPNGVGFGLEHTYPLSQFAGL